MALPNPLVEVQGSRLMLGPDGGQQAVFLINPGSADYPVGGYAITNIQLRLRLITDAVITGCNEEAAGFLPQIVLPLAQLQSAITSGPSAAVGAAAGVPFSQTDGAAVSGYSQLLFRIFENSSGTGRMVELTTNYDLLGLGWLLRVTGY